MAFEELTNKQLKKLYKEAHDRLNAAAEAYGIEMSEENKTAFDKAIDESSDAFAELRKRNVPGFRLKDIPIDDQIKHTFNGVFHRMDEKEFFRVATHLQKLLNLLMKMGAFTGGESDQEANEVRFRLIADLSRLNRSIMWVFDLKYKDNPKYGIKGQR